MWRDLNITKQDWERTPAAVRTVLLSLQQQGRLLLIRCTAYENEIAALRQQATQIDDLKAEMAKLLERLRQNSQNYRLHRGVRECQLALFVTRFLLIN